MSNMSFLKRVAAATTLAAAAAGSAHAAPIVGNFAMSFGEVEVSAFTIDWTPNPPSGGPFGYSGTIPGSGTYGEFQMVTGGRSGSFQDPVFSSLPNSGIVKDLSANPLSPNYFPVATPVSIVDFLLLQEKTGAGTNYWQFNATTLGAGQTIGPVLTPFVLADTAQGATVQIGISGLACYGAGVTCNIADPDTSAWSAVFSATYVGQTVAQLISIIQGGGTLANTTWSGTFTASRIPEPATLALVGLALAGAGFASRRKSSKAA